MTKIFIIVRDSLQFFANLSGLSYTGINIIVYYFIIPFVFIFFIDKIFNMDYLKISYGIGLVLSILLINDFEKFSIWLFKKSASFLNSFSFLGWDYTLASVIICVFIPILVLSFLIYYTYKWNHPHHTLCRVIFCRFRKY